MSGTGTWLARIHWPRLTRDGVLFAGGLGLTVNEALIRQGPERPTMLLLFAAMMGLPFVLRGDEARQKRGGGS